MMEDIHRDSAVQIEKGKTKNGSRGIELWGLFYYPLLFFIRTSRLGQEQHFFSKITRIN